jgi:uracil-DNA glycosylase family 4
MPIAAPECSRCPLQSKIHDRVVPCHGNRDATVALVGEGPGKLEEKYKRPFIGPAGQELNWLLKSVHGPPRDELFITNAAMCIPHPVSVKNEYQQEIEYLTYSDTLEKSTQDTCRARLHSELELVKPRVVLAVGNYALRSLTGRQGVLKLHGSIFPTTIGQHRTLVIPMLHPAALLRNPKDTYGVQCVLRKAFRIAATGSPVPDSYYGAKHCISPYHPAGPDGALDILEAAIDELASKPQDIALDVESTSEHPRTATLTVLGFATLENAYAVSLIAWNVATQRFEECWTPAQKVRVIALLTRLLQLPLLKWAWNVGFDRTICERDFPNVNPRWADGLHWHWLIQPECDHHLSFAAQSYNDIGSWKADFWAKQDAGTATHNDLDDYNADDCRYTIHTVPHLKQEARRRGVEHLVDHQMEVNELAREAELYGIPVCKDTWQELFDQYDAKKQEALTFIRNAVRGHESALNASVDRQKLREARLRARKTGKFNAPKPSQVTADEFNPNSPHQARWLLFEHLKLNVARKTKGEQKSTSYKGILTYLSKPLVKAYVNFNEYAYKVQWLNAIARKAEISEDGSWRLYVSWNTCGTRGTRWTSKLINLQNIEKKMRKLIRAKKGRVWVGADLAQVEFRTAACLAGLTDLFPLFNERSFDEDLEPWKKYDPDYDAHSITATQVYGDAYTNQAKEFARCTQWLMVRLGCTAPEALYEREMPDDDCKAVLARAKAAVGVLGPWRTLVKRVTFALFYGARPPKILTSLREDRRLSPELRATLTEARIAEIWQGFNERFPAWERWANRELDHAERKGYQTFPPLNRKRYWTQKELEANKIKNTPIQLSAGDSFNLMAKDVCRRVKEEGLDAVFTIHGHDCIYLDTAEKDAERVKQIVNESFKMWLEGPYGKVYLTGQASIGATVADVG